MNTPHATINSPRHLPPKLSISMWYQNWAAMTLPGAPYDDLERCIKGMKERGFNTARVGVGMNYAFRFDGSPRGPMAFDQPVPGYGSIFIGFKAK